MVLERKLSLPMADVMHSGKKAEHKCIFSVGVWPYESRG